MTKQMDDETKTRKERLKLIYGALNIYGSNDRERLFLETPKCRRRYAALARKVLSHYAGNKYNPHTVEYHVEDFIRQHIAGFVEQKVFFKLKDYDWEYIDNFFKRVVSELMGIDIPYDVELFERGMNHVYEIPIMQPHPTKQ